MQSTMHRNKKTFPCWVEYIGFDVYSQMYPDQLFGEYKGTFSRFTDLSSFYRTNLIGFQNRDLFRDRLFRVDRSCMDRTPANRIYSSVPFGITDELREAFAGELLSITGFGGEGMVIPACSGSVGIDHAIRAAWQYHARKKTGKRKIVSLERSYHGTTALCLAAGHYPFGKDNRNITGLYLPDEIKNLFIKIPPPADSNAICQDLDDILKRNNDIAALIYEPVQGAGATTPNKEYFSGLNDVAKKHDILLIADEVATFARLGTWLASTYFNVKPDMVVLGKGLSNGFAPIAATILSPEIYEALETYDVGTKDFGETLAWTPFLAQLGINVLAYIEAKNLLEKGPQQGENIRKILLEKLANTPIKVEGIGGMSRLNIGDHFTAHHLALRLLDKGYFTYTTQGSIYVESPLVGSSVNYDELGEVINELYDSIKKMRNRKQQRG